MKKSVMILIIIISMILFAGCQQPAKQLEVNEYKYGDLHNRQVLEISTPKGLKENEKRKAILYIHGGGWTAGDKRHFRFMEEATLSYGYIYISMNYGYAANDRDYLDLLIDIDTAMDFLVSNANSYNLDVSGIALYGSSAGSHLALLYAYKYEETPIPVKLVVSRVGPTDFTDEGYIGEIIHSSIYGMLSSLMNHTYQKSDIENAKNDSRLIDASPIYHVSESTPPTILAYGKKDHLVPYSNATKLKDKLEAFQIEHHLITFDNSGHELTSVLDEAKNHEFITYVVAALNKFLKNE